MWYATLTRISHGRGCLSPGLKGEVKNSMIGAGIKSQRSEMRKPHVEFGCCYIICQSAKTLRIGSVFQILY